jgi:hypothetical protein
VGIGTKRIVLSVVVIATGVAVALYAKERDRSDGFATYSKESLQIGKPLKKTISLQNKMAETWGSITIGEFGAARHIKSKVRDLIKPEILEFQVPEGSTSLFVKVTSPETQPQDVDLYLYDCTQERCYLWDIARSGGKHKAEMLVRRPRKGVWKSVVCVWQPFTEPPVFEYWDMYTNPSFGDITGDRQQVARKTGEKWKQDFRLNLKQMPGDDRKLTALFEFIDEKAEQEELKRPLWTPMEGRYMDRPIAIGRLIQYMAVKGS